MNAAMDAYNRLLAAQRVIPLSEQEQHRTDSEQALKRAAIRRKLPKVY